MGKEDKNAMPPLPKEYVSSGEEMPPLSDEYIDTTSQDGEAKKKYTRSVEWRIFGILIATRTEYTN